MPVCQKCGIMQATAEMRRFKDHWLCKERHDCKRRQKVRMGAPNGESQAARR